MKWWRVIQIWVAVVLLLSFSSCKKEEKGSTVTLTLTTSYGSQPFTIGTPNTDPKNRRLKVDKFRFYLSHIALVKTDNSVVTLSDVALFDCSNPDTWTIKTTNLSGNFKALRFNTGLDSLQNQTDPLSLPDGNPLSNNSGMYWPWLRYIFYEFESRCDTTGTGSGAYDWFPLYHIGTSVAYRQVELPKSFSVCCDARQDLTLHLDVKKIFYGDTQTLDIISESTTQMGNSDDPNVAVKFSDNFSKAFSF